MSRSEDPTYLTFLPVLCAVWADDLLDEHELEAVADVVERSDWITREGRTAIREWLDPDSPPTPSAFEQATASIARARGPSDLTLTKMGLTLAGASGAGHEGLEWQGEAAASLGQLELALGLVGVEALRQLTEGTPPPSHEPHRDTALAEEVGRLVEGDHPDLRRAVRGVLQRPELQIPDELPRAEYRERTLSAVRVLADEGFGVLGFPAAYGGGKPGEGIVVFEELALGDLSVLIKYGVQFGLFGGSIAQLGTEKHHEETLARIGDLSLPGCYAMTETAHGSNVREIATTATYDADSRTFLVNTPDDDARKDYIGNAALHGQLATVFAQLRVAGEDHGVHALLVPIRTPEGAVVPGVRIEDCGAKEGLNGVDNGRLWFDDVRVPRDALLDRFAQVTVDGEYRSDIPTAGRRFFTMLGTLVAGRISIAAASHTVAKKALTIAIRYGARRRQFGPVGEPETPILDYLSVQRSLLPRLATSYAMTFAVRDLIRRFADPATDRRRLEVRAAGLKSVASWHALDTLQACREACGGQGYLAENQFGRMKADTDVFATFEGANPVLLQLVAKGLLSRHSKELGDLSMWGMVRYLAELAGTRVADMNPLITRRTDPEHLADLDVHMAALTYREQRLLRSAARRLRSRIVEGMDSFQAMNDCQDHLITLAQAHVDRILLATALDGLETVPDSPAGALLRDVIRLFGLSTLERHRAWFLETGYFDPPKSEAIRAEVNRRCRDLAAHAVELVDAFGIPDALIRAPIAIEAV